MHTKFHEFSNNFSCKSTQPKPLPKISGRYDYANRHPNKLCRVGSVSSVSASRTVGREFASRPGHTKDHHKNGTNCLPA